MRIVVNDIAASTGGALSILRDFYEYVKQHDFENEWIFLTGGNYIEETGNVKVIVMGKVKASKLEKLKFDLISGRKFINRLEPDVVFSMQNIITFGVNARQIVYVHQSIPFQNIKKFSFLKNEERRLAVYQYIIGYFIKKSVRKADKVIVQTKWMRKAVIDKTKILPVKIINVLPNVKIEGYAHLDKCADINKKEQYIFFYPTGVGIYKNIKCITEAVTILNQCGYKDFQIKLTVNDKELEQYHCNSNNIIPVGRLNREDVYKEYLHSTLIFPSYIETFGYPMAEARLMGTIVLASDCPFSHEVLEGYENAYFFDPFSPAELAELMKQVMNNTIKKKKIALKENNKKNGWERVYEEVVSQV